MKEYKDLSRRALIKLGNDFDKEHDGELMQYLNDHPDDYEDIRPIETIVQRTDQLVETVSASCIGTKITVNKAANAMINKAADLAIENVGKIAGNIGTAIITKMTI